MVGATLVRKPSFLADPGECTHPLEARRLGGRAGVTIVCIACGCRAETSRDGADERGRIH